LNVPCEKKSNAEHTRVDAVKNREKQKQGRGGGEYKVVPSNQDVRESKNFVKDSGNGQEQKRKFGLGKEQEREGKEGGAAEKRGRQFNKKTTSANSKKRTVLTSSAASTKIRKKLRGRG